MTSRRAALLGAATLLVLASARRDTWPGLRGPAPYPPDWQWGYAPRPVVPARLVPAAGLATAIVGLAVLAGPAAAGAGAAVGLLGAACVIGTGFQAVLLHVEPQGAIAELERRTRSGSFTSYFKVAGEVGEIGPFLASYHERLPGFRHHALHAATHPPGPILYYVVLRRLVARAPGLSARFGGESRTTALAGALLLGLLGAAACFPLALLARSAGASPGSALRTGVLWTLVPGLCLMVPEVDQALALPVTGAAAAVGWALDPAAARVRLVGGGIVAGLLAGIAAFFSYGSPLLVALGSLAVAVPALGKPEGRRRVDVVAAVAIVTAAACFALPSLLGYHPVESAVTALAIHREHFTLRRSYTRWLFFDLVDLALFLGVPVVLFRALGSESLARSLSWGALRTPQTPSAVALFRWTAAAGVLLLVASGLVRGEMGRLLIPVMPVLLAACVVAPPAAGAAEGEPSPSTAVILAILLAAADVVLRLSWELP